VRKRRIVLTGGPGAGKTAVLDLLRHELCEHVAILPEAAGLVFAGGFPRNDKPEVRRAAQRAIFHVQSELEAAFEANGSTLLLCDRGAVDGAAYWPGPDDFWNALGTTRRAILDRYDVVIHLRVPPAPHYGHQNPLRTETAAEARAIDDRILESSSDFVEKARQALEAIRAELPKCCNRVTGSQGITDAGSAVRRLSRETVSPIVHA
jgi:predicted ATPase